VSGQTDARRPPRVVVIGSANIDLVVRVPALPRPGETVAGGTFRRVGGGKGANQAVAAARAGGAVTFVAKLGDDEFGTASLAAYEAEGVDTSRITRAPGCPTGVAFILVDDRGENAIAVADGANGRLAPADVDAAHDAIATADVVLVQLEVPIETCRHAIALAAGLGRRVILNPAPARELDAELLAQVAVITPNETEAERLTGMHVSDEASAAAAAARLRSQGPAAVVLTLGPRGCLVAADGPPSEVAGHPVTAVDTVAAGDVFNGCLAVALAEGHALLTAAAFANTAAAIAVTRHGAQDSAPRRAEIEAWAGGRAWRAAGR
jgi:ribokinase